MWNVSKDKKMNWEWDHWSRFPCDPENIPEHFSNRFSPFSEPLLGILLTYQRSADIIRSQSNVYYGPIEELQRIKLLHNIFIITRPPAFIAQIGYWRGEQKGEGGWVLNDVYIYCHVMNVRRWIPLTYASCADWKNVTFNKSASNDLPL